MGFPKGKYFCGQRRHLHTCPELHRCCAIKYHNETAYLKARRREGPWQKPDVCARRVFDRSMLLSCRLKMLRAIGNMPAHLQQEVLIKDLPPCRLVARIEPVRYMPSGYEEIKCHIGIRRITHEAVVIMAELTQWT
jgi:hypothetical protein